MGLFDQLLGSGRVEKDRPVLEERIQPSLPEKIGNLSATGRANVASAVKRQTMKYSFPTVKPSFSMVSLYVDGMLRGDDSDVLVRKCRLDRPTARLIDQMIEKEVNKVLY